MKFKLQSSEGKISPLRKEERDQLKSVGLSFDEYDNVNDIDIEINSLDELIAIEKKCGYPLVVDVWDGENIITIFNTMEY